MKHIKSTLGLFALLTLPFCPAQAQNGVVTATNDGTSVTVGNGYLKRSFSISGNQLKPGNLVNLRTGGSGTTFTPSAGSEEFTLMPCNNQGAIAGRMPLDRKGWSVTASSWCEDGNNGAHPDNTLDGDFSTFWHSNYPNGGAGTGSYNLPYTLVYNLNGAKTFNAFGYVARQDSPNGRMSGYKLEISDNGDTWQLIKQGYIYLVEAEPVWVELGQDYTAKYIRLTETSTQSGDSFGTMAEFYLSAEVAQEGPAGIAASQMKIDKVTISDIEGGKRVLFDMQPYAYKAGQTSTWDIDMVVEMKDGDHFMRKYLLVGAADENARQTQIDYIEMEHLGVAGVAYDHKWARQQAGGGEGGMSAYTLTLGQPTYIEGMFFGSEFPQAENEIEEGSYYTRYYSGKSLAYLGDTENRLNADGQFRTWSNVIGAARSATNMDIIRTDFYQYIESIARPIKPRFQYNSWYDWMLTITEDRINSSFKEMERGYSQYGLRPMDSYVVDDGWNNYNRTDDPDRSGYTSNVSGFWEFNSKFPTGLDGASQIARNFGSGFGMWLGPRGGYNFNSSWGRFLEEQGTGTYNRSSDDAVTGDKVYIGKLQDFFLKCQSEYGTNYWKLDGFSTKQPQASKNDRYITGGKNGNYYFTEHWERWYKTFETMYKEAEGRNDNLWLNLTCYVNPSPWILQWCNSVWIQNSGDMGRLVVDGRYREMDKQLSYRDGRYHDYVNNRQIQFPFAHMFNHDPIYGKTDCMAPNAMTDSEFRSYLYMMSARGHAFWEMLYSYNMMNEGNKWMINAEAHNFIDKNYEVLRNSIYFGNFPSDGGIYGYSCWDKDDQSGKVEGIVSFRNPSNSQKNYTFTFDNKVGVPESMQGLTPSLIMEYSGNSREKAEDVNNLTGKSNEVYSYGSTYTITLKGGECRLLRFAAQDVVPAKFYTVTSTRKNQVVVKFEEPVKAAARNFSLYQNGQKVATATDALLAADYRTVTVTFDAVMDASKPYTVKAENLEDWNGNVCNEQSPAFYSNPEGDILSIRSAGDLAQTEGVQEGKLFGDGFKSLTLSTAQAVKDAKTFMGKGSFTLSFALKTKAAQASLVKQGDEFSASLVGGKIQFTVKGVTYTSKKSVNDNRKHYVVCLRENNGMVKVYINGKLDGTGYDGQKVNGDVAAAPVVLGQEGTEVTLGAVRLRIAALDFKAVASEYEGIFAGEGGESVDISTELNEAKELLALQGVGYPVGSDRDALETAYADAENAENPTEGMRDQLRNAIRAYKRSTNVAMPEEGKAYTFTTHHMDGVNRYFYYDTAAGKVTTAVREKDAMLPLSAIFVCKQVGDKYMFVNNDGKYLVWFGGQGDGAYVGNDGFTDNYDAGKNLFQVIKFTKESNVAVELEKYFGCVGMVGTRAEGDEPYFILKSDGGAVASSDPFIDNSGTYRTSAIAIEEVEYANHPKLEVINNSEKIALPEAKTMATFSAPFAVKVPEQLTAYYVTTLENNNALVTKIDAGLAIPARQGVILTGQDTQVKEALLVPATTESAAALEKNLLSHTAGMPVSLSGTNFVLSVVGNQLGFFPTEAATLGMNQAYLHTDAQTTSIRLAMEGDVTGIDGVEADEGEKVVYDLSGRRVQTISAKGCYIVNGKKVIVK